MVISNLLGRSKSIFADDIEIYDLEIKSIVSSSRFLVLGGAGSIGREVVKEIFKRNPLALDVVDINENNLAELVRDLRSSFGYIKGEFHTYTLDVGSRLYDIFIESRKERYDYVLNLSALKHVRSEKDPFTLMRMIEVNILNTLKSIKHSVKYKASKYFCVSTDKAANPVNMMGASKRIMELFLLKESKRLKISTARFANVAFSDGSLLHSFTQRIEKRQPIVAPNDVSRYFISPQESGELCLMSTILGLQNEILFPKFESAHCLKKFSTLAIDFLKIKGYEPYICSNEQEAREFRNVAGNVGKWPCYFAGSDTTGEKEVEEFFIEGEDLDFNKFKSIGIVKSKLEIYESKLSDFLNELELLKSSGNWSKSDLIELFNIVLGDFKHLDKGKYLDSKM